ncbi:ubiquitin thioesterase ZRANB1 isoform X2 [Takifugu flavidus]|uniref:ubiquitin thioesterase ZRANB1 isoform X2 n=1 Tax=Takifugu flavidus TaxID=433684 RepID=UPI0025441D74|nr:ubiquitin thioesterase ZRANB1 isoform X2 [Takifugu flavidus]
MTEQRIKWVCDYCTYENWPSAIKCTMCRAQRSRGPIITEEPYKLSSDLDPSLEWGSPRTESGSSLLICPDSSARPRVRSTNMVEIANKWSCQICTYLNWPRAIRCTQCLCQRPRTTSPTESPQTSCSNAGCRSTLHSPIDTCEEYNDRNRLNTHQPHWTCTACTYQNWPSISKCVVCDHPKPNNLETTEQAEFCEPTTIINEQDRARWRGICSGGQGQTRRSPPTLTREDSVKMDFQRIELAAGAMSSNEDQEVDFKKLKQIRNRMKKTDWLFLNACADIEDLPPAVQEKLFDEVLDRDVQKELEEESPVINWSLELGTRLDSRLYALWNRTAGDCLLDSVLQATWGIYDKDSVLRKTLHDSLHDCSHWFYTRWKEWESWYSQSFGLHFSLREEQWQEDWAFILSLASQPGASLEQTHIFVLAHILRRPIIVYGVKYYKSFRGETLGYTRFQGVYLPLLWEQSFCWKSPIALGYTRGHFSALVAMENDGYDNRGAGANLNTDDDVNVTFLPLVDSERKLLHVHFLSAQENGNEEQQEKLLREWLDCCVTEGGVLVAMQKSSRRRNHPLVTQMVEKWLDRYRQIRPCASLSDGEEEEDEDE